MVDGSNRKGVGNPEQVSCDVPVQVSCHGRVMNNLVRTLDEEDLGDFGKP